MKNKILVSILLAIFVGMFVMLYFRNVSYENYSVLLAAPCDPLQESCFIKYCDPEEEECSEVEEENISYYKETYRTMRNIVASCEGSLEGCEEESFYNCMSGEKNCEVIYCDESNSEESCSSTEQ